MSIHFTPATRFPAACAAAWHGCAAGPGPQSPAERGERSGGEKVPAGQAVAKTPCLATLASEYLNHGFGLPGGLPGGLP